MAKVGDKPTEDEVGRVIFFIYKDSFDVAHTTNISSDELVSLMLITIEQLTGSTEKQLH